MDIENRKGMKLKEICENIVNRNIITNKGIDAFRAGSSVYANLWARDFLYPAPYLMSVPKWRASVADHIFLILDHKRDSDHMMPKGIDTMNFDWRVVRGTIRNVFGLGPEELPVKGEWRGLYTDTLGSDAVDTNLLLVNAIMELAKYPEYKDRVYERKQDILDAMKYYKQYTKSGLIYQMEFSDFQDSSAREGATFLTNLLYWKSIKELERAKFIKSGYSKELKERIKRVFWVEKHGIYKGIRGRKFMNIDANLLAIDWGFDTRKSFWKSIKDYRPWWNKGSDLPKNDREGLYPGPPTVPVQPYSEKAICVKLVNIPGYHDEYFWSWVLGLAAKVAYKMGDCEEGDRLIKLAKNTVERDLTTYDAYALQPNGDIIRVVTYGFKSEYDWTWGASYILAALEEKIGFSKL